MSWSMPPNGRPVRHRGSSGGGPLVMDTAGRTRDSNPTKGFWDTVIWTPTPASLGFQRHHRFRGLDPAPKQFLLKANDRCQHSLIVDFSGRDDNAAIHEVGHSVRQLPLTLGLENGFIEHLGWTERRSVELWVSLKCLDADLRRRANFICHQCSHGPASLSVVHVRLAGAN